MRWWLPSLILVGGAIGTLAAGTEPQRLVTLSPNLPPKEPVVVPPQDPSSIPTVTVTAPPAPPVVKPPHGPSAQALANVLGELRHPKPATRSPPPRESVAAAVPPRPPPERIPPPINLLPPPQPTQPSLLDREAFLQLRAFRLDIRTARDLLLAGQPIDARHVLDNAAIHVRLIPSERGNQQQINVAIRALDAGDTMMAVRVINQVLATPPSAS